MLLRCTGGYGTDLITSSMLSNPLPSNTFQCSNPFTALLLEAQLSSLVLAQALACTAAHTRMCMHSYRLCNLDSPRCAHTSRYSTWPQPPRELTGAHSAVHRLQSEMPAVASPHQPGLVWGSGRTWDHLQPPGLLTQSLCRCRSRGAKESTVTPLAGT